MSEAKEAFHALLNQWVEMCATTPEFVAQYNRLNKSAACFDTKARTPIEAMVDKACGHIFTPDFDTEDNSQFVKHCVDLFLIMNGLPASSTVEG
jgi:hypothetical protein